MRVLGPHFDHDCEPATDTHYRCLECNLVVPLPAAHEPLTVEGELTADGDGSKGAGLVLKAGIS